MSKRVLTPASINAARRNGAKSARGNAFPESPDHLLGLHKEYLNSGKSGFFHTNPQK